MVSVSCETPICLFPFTTLIPTAGLWRSAWVARLSATVKYLSLDVLKFQEKSWRDHEASLGQNLFKYCKDFASLPTPPVASVQRWQDISETCVVFKTLSNHCSTNIFMACYLQNTITFLHFLTCWAALSSLPLFIFSCFVLVPEKEKIWIPIGDAQEATESSVNLMFSQFPEIYPSYPMWRENGF